MEMSRYNLLGVYSIVKNGIPKPIIEELNT
jgi:hypothetical protein